MALQNHDVTIKHRSRILHVNAYVLSRWPRVTDADHTGARMVSGTVVAPMLPPVIIDGVEQASQTVVQHEGMNMLSSYHNSGKHPA